MNRLRMIPKLFGLDLNEVFHIQENPDLEFKFNNDGFLFSSPLDETEWRRCSSRVLEELLVGLRHVVSAPWRPEYGEKYFVPDIYWASPACKELFWFGDNEDEAYYEAGLICKTKDMTITKVKMMLAVAKE